eukprot:g10724.t2
MRVVKSTSLVLSCINISRRTNALSASTRGRSRHTSGFEPFETFELAPQELIASTQPIGAEQQHELHLQPTRGSSVFQWIQSSMADGELAEAASRCVLLHGLFEVWGHGRDQEEAVKDAITSRRFGRSADASSWSLGVTSYGRSNLTKAEQQALAGGPVGEFLSKTINGPRTESLNSDIRIRIIEDACPSPAENLPQDVRRRAAAEAAAAAAAAPASGRREKRFYICRELQVGAAVGAGGTVLATACGRRPIRGVLGVLALNRRRCRGPTAIEPEVALVMANLAKVRPGSRVLDPFCGLCSLLLPAANMGAETFGSDVSGPATAADRLHAPDHATQATAVRGRQEGEQDGGAADSLPQAGREDLENLLRDFGALGLAPPTLVAADVGDERSRIRRPRFYDAIITDPPYNIKAKVVTTTNDDIVDGRRQAKPLFSRRSGEFPSRRVKAGSASRVAAVPGLNPMVDVSRQRPRETDDDIGTGNSGGCPQWKAGEGAKAVAYANDLVGEVVWSLLSLARYSLKPGGRLCFFLPLRGAEAQLDKLPAVLLERLSEGGEDDGAREGKRLSIVYATKQRMTSPNICRWLIVLEKEARVNWRGNGGA